MAFCHRKPDLTQHSPAWYAAQGERGGYAANPARPADHPSQSAATYISPSKKHTKKTPVATGASSNNHSGAPTGSPKKTSNAHQGSPKSPSLAALLVAKKKEQSGGSPNSSNHSTSPTTTTATRHGHNHTRHHNTSSSSHHHSTSSSPNGSLSSSPSSSSAFSHGAHTSVKNAAARTHLKSEHTKKKSTTGTTTATKHHHTTKPPIQLASSQQEIGCISLGSRVSVYDKNAGTCRYLGEMHGKEGLWAGVELDYPRGKSDGTVMGVQYFKCKPNYGTFVPHDTVKLYDEDVAAAVRIQCMIRRYKSQRTARHRKVFKNWNKLESAAESAQFAASSNHNLVVPMLDNLKKNTTELNKADQRKKQIALGSGAAARMLASAASRPAICGLTWNEVESLAVEDSYSGPHIQFPMSNDCAVELAHAFLHEPDTVLHYKYLLLLLLHINDHLETNVMNAVMEVQLKEGQTMNIIGDTHGQLADVLWIFHLCGYPTEDRMFFFNGDVADRGQNAVEIFAIIFSFMLLGRLWMTRGNHEAAMLNQRPADQGGGFQREILKKYPGQQGHTLYKVFEKVFDSLALAGTLNNEICIIHGGLPRREGIRLEHIKQVDHKREVPCPTPGSSYQDQVFFDMLWSDPCDRKGIRPSDRGGEAIMFGPDISGAFLEDNELSLLVRSHQCPESLRGYEECHGGNVITVFSASNYGECGNYGGLLEVKCVAADEALDITGHEFMAPVMSELIMEVVKSEHEGVQKQRSDRAAEAQAQAEKKLQKDMLRRIKSIIVGKKTELEWFWEQCDSKDTGLVTAHNWISGMKAVLELDLQWKDLMPYLAPADSDGMVDYRAFCKRFKIVFRSKDGEQAGKPKWETSMLSILYESVMRADLSMPKILEAFGEEGSELSDSEIARRMASTADLGLSLPQLEYVIKGVRSAAIRQTGAKITGASFAELFVQTFMQHCEAKEGDSEDLRLVKKLGRLLQRYPSSCAGIFQKFDFDNDGFVDYDEFIAAMSSMQDESCLAAGNCHEIDRLSKSEIRSVCSLIDSNKDGHINFIEFCQAFYAEGHSGTVEDLMQQLHTTLFENSVTLASMFQHFDEEGDGDGTVSTAELKMGLSTLNTLLSRTTRPPLSDVQINAIATCIDRNGDGRIEWEEFLDAFIVVDSAE